MPLAPTFLTRLGAVCLSAFVVTLAACGGAQEAAPLERSAGASSALSRQAEGGTAAGPAPAQEAAQLAQGARLSSADLQAAELQAQTLDQAAVDKTGPTEPLASLLPGQIAPKSAYLSGDVARKAAAVRIPAYRFYNGSTGAHFYTVSETERATVASTLSPPFSYDGPAFSVASDHSGGLASVHRFFNTRTGVHFYTISESERQNVVASLPQFTYEGVAYYASPVAGAGLVPLYRFYVPGRGFHFYTASATERDTIIATLGHIYSYEGIGYHVLDGTWAARQRVPHTGITTNQCYRAGSNVLEACGGSSPMGLNPQQDGHRTDVAPMSYSAVFAFNLPLTGPVYYANTDCVRDDVTGLVWEGKTAGGTRAGSNTYTNLGNGAATDASGYVNAVNASNLCGYSDWRLPTRNELVTLVDYGKTTGAPINATWFPNTALGNYWSADVQASDTTFAWNVSWAPGSDSTYTELRSSGFAVRLVRGSGASGQRFTYSTVPYGTDSALNVVNDAQSGLQWRRCVEGRVWNGITCTGANAAMSQENALAHARDHSGWRLPNVKELTSLTNLSAASGGAVHAEAFPAASTGAMWTSTPQTVIPGEAWSVSFYDGELIYYPRGSGANVRLVRTSP